MDFCSRLRLTARIDPETRHFDLPVTPAFVLDQELFGINLDLCKQADALIEPGSGSLYVLVTCPELGSWAADEIGSSTEFRNSLEEARKLMRLIHQATLAPTKT